MKKLAIGVDIGGINTAFGLVDENGDLYAESVISTKKYPYVDDYPAYVEDLCDSMRALAQSLSFEYELTGIKRTAIEQMSKMNAPSKLRSIAFDDFDASMISAAAEQGDPIALEAFRYTGEMLGRALADVVTVTSPQAIFLFGGLS